MLPSCSINIFSLKTVLKQSGTIKLFFPFNRKTGLLPFPPQLCCDSCAGGGGRAAQASGVCGGERCGDTRLSSKSFYRLSSPQILSSKQRYSPGVISRSSEQDWGVNIFIPYFQMWFAGRGKEPPAALQFTFPEASPSPRPEGASRPWPRMRRRGKAVLPVLPCPSHRSPALSPRPRGQVCACPAPRARPSSRPGTGLSSPHSPAPCPLPP